MTDMKTVRRGVWLVFEGNDGAGKTSAIEQVVKHYGDLVTVLAFPSEILKKSLEINNPKKAKGLAHIHDMAQYVEFIYSEMRRGQIVICDRWVYSTYAYEVQIPYQVLRSVAASAFNGNRPDRVLWFDTPLSICQDVVESRGEVFNLPLQTRVASMYEQMHKSNPDHIQQVSRHLQQLWYYLGAIEICRRWI